MGPFGTIVIVPMLPELRESFGASSSAVSWGFTIYLLPFAVMLLVSGTLGERWGRRRTVRGTYLVYAAASLVCALAPNLGWFLAGRALQGLANAFITPLLVAGLAEVVSPDRFGRAVGMYSSFQAVGGGLAPVLGGLAADVDWRWAFVGTAAMALVLSFAPPTGEPRSGVQPPSLAPLLTRRMIGFGVGVFAAAAGPIGIAVLVGVAARDVLDLSGTAAGLLLLAGPAAAMLAGPLWGRLLDAWGPRRAGFVSVGSVTAASAALAFAGTPVTLAAVSALTGALAAFVVVVVQGMSTTIAPDNRGGTLSFVLSFRFLGHGVGPVVWIPVLEFDVELAFLGASALGLVTLAAFSLAPTRAAGAES